VGHNALGAGQVFDQGAKLVEEALASGALFAGETWRWLVEGAAQSGEPLHFIGLLSDGNVHSHEAHLHAMLRQAAREGLRQVRIHVLLDGRDVGERSALVYLDRLDAVLAELNADGRDYRIASGGGRMTITMDRYEAEWAMVDRGWQLHVRGEGRAFDSAREAIETFRAEDPAITDQFLPGFVVRETADSVRSGQRVGPIRPGASVCFFNFRGDRAIEITRAFEDEILTTFPRGPRIPVRFAGMMQYDGDLHLPKRYLVTPPAIANTLGEYLVHNGVRQFACSETQKYGHVTYFWNGNRSEKFDDKLETYQEIPSDVIPFEQRPWMKAAEITDATLAAMATHKHLRINFANGDMVGHTGVRDAAVLAVEAVDHCLGRLLAGVAMHNGVALITADHGNCDEMFSRSKSGAFELGAGGIPVPRTSHTLNPVPLSLFDPHGLAPRLAATVPQPGLANVAATITELLGFKPAPAHRPSLLGEG
jgi:2,3-bisphosphoglycerate-independent phosphoglycerate mutase